MICDIIICATPSADTGPLPPLTSPAATPPTPPPKPVARRITPLCITPSGGGPLPCAASLLATDSASRSDTSSSSLRIAAAASRAAVPSSSLCIAAIAALTAPASRLATSRGPRTRSPASLTRSTRRSPR